MNNQPGQGLGFTASKLIADGLGTPYTIVIVIIQPPPPARRPGGGLAFDTQIVPTKKVDKKFIDDLRTRILQDDNEIIEIIMISIEAGIIK